MGEKHGMYILSKQVHLRMCNLLLQGKVGLPVAGVFSQSTKSVVAMGGLHLVFWLVGTVFGLRFLSAGFRHFDAHSGAGLKVWVVVFLLVVLQMTTALRPIVGKSKHFLPAADDKEFFVTHWINCVNAETDTNAPAQDAAR